MSNLPPGWVETEIGKIAHIETGNTPPKSNAALYGREICFYKPADLDVGGVIFRSEDMVSGAGANAGRMLPKNTLLVTCIGNLGKSALIGAPAICNQQINAVLPTLAADPRYLYYWSRTIRPWLEENSSATTVAIINKGRFSKAPISLSPLPEQRRIVAKIDSLTAKSARARDHLDHIHRLVEKYKQAVLRAAFRGYLTKASREEGAQQYRWRTTVLGEIADIQSGVALGKRRSSNVHLLRRPYLRVANVQRGWLNLEEIKEIEVSEQEAERLYLRPGDILMNEGGDRDKLGRGWVWDGQIVNCIHQNHVFRVRLLDPEFPPKLISLYANEFGQAHFFDEGTQTTNLASISKRKLSSLPLRLPPAREAIDILKRIESAFAWIDRLAKEATSARKFVDHLDQAVLAKAFRGELVPQDPNDEPADVLLERIRAERVAMASQPRPRGRVGKRA